MMEGANLMKMVQQKIAEKDEVIHEQQRQIAELSEALEEKDAVIREMMTQIEGGEAPAATPSESEAVAEKEALIHEQMQQIMELTEKVEELEVRITDYDRQLKEMLGN